MHSFSKSIHAQSSWISAFQMYDEEWKPISHEFASHEKERYRRIIRRNVFDALSILEFVRLVYLFAKSRLWRSKASHGPSNSISVRSIVVSSSFIVLWCRCHRRHGWQFNCLGGQIGEAHNARSSSANQRPCREPLSYRHAMISYHCCQKPRVITQTRVR